MPKRADEARRRHRRTGRWFGVVAMAAAIGICAVGCATDPSALGMKAEGDDAVAVGPMPEIDPASISGIAYGTASVEAGGEVADVMPEMLAEARLPASLQSGSAAPRAYEEPAASPFLHIVLASAERLSMLGNTVSSTDGCLLKSGRWLDLPYVVDHVEAGGIAESCSSWSGGASVQATYKIGGSAYLLWTYAKVPEFGFNEVKCTILNAKDWSEAKSSPYTCSYEWLQDNGHGINPMPKIKLWSKPDITVTDPVQVEQILSANCKKAGPNCVFDAKVQRVETLPKKEWILYGSPQGNCIKNSHAVLKVGNEQEVSWKKIVGVTASGEMEIGPVKAGIEATYEYAWSEKQVFKEEHEMTIPEGKIAGFYIAAGVLHVEGDFTVRTNSATYLLPNAVFKLPLTEDYHDGDTVIKKGPILPASWDCPASGNLGAEQTPEYGLPDGAEVLDPTKTN